MAKNDIIITPRKPRLNYLEQRIASFEYHIRSRTNDLRILLNNRLPDEREAYLIEKRRHIARCKITKLAGADLMRQAFGEDAQQSNVGYYRERVQSIRLRIEENKAYNTNDESELAALQAQVAQMQEAAAPPIVINRAKTRKELLALDNVAKIAFSDTGNDVSLTVFLTDLTMSNLPDHNEVADYIAWHVNTTTPDAVINPRAVPIDDCAIRIVYNRQSGDCTLYGRSTIERGPFDTDVNGTRLHRFHPHWISTSSPCLGDYSGPIHEAINSLDYQTAVTLITMYLTTYNLDDSAGRYGIFYGMDAQQAQNYHRMGWGFWDWMRERVNDTDYTTYLNPQSIAA